MKQLTLSLLAGLTLMACSEQPDEDRVQGPGYGNNATRNDWPDLSLSQVSSEELLSDNYFIIFDGSGSMGETNCSGDLTKAEVAIEAVGHFIDKIPSSANVGLMVFDNTGVATRVPIGGNNRFQLKQAISEVEVGGGTPLKTTLEQGMQALEQQAAKQLGYGEYNIVVVTDGVASENESPTQTVKTIYQNSPVSIHTIGFCLGEQHALNQPGITYYKSADDQTSLSQGLASVLAESESFTDIATFQ